ncbi:hypothetical protein CMO83_02715 [Candidatus Woesearchaeota archaeon]|jgi:chorismate mutase|nr:hypothetical protein [Candidatus Woesearchaeota archaeon]MDP6648098.1 chorismate mutase [Candidatus Woesearchaeota archaeon]|tara:strand:- start:2547 stop:2822 length:276 start_codon:yes stop_codon:yes gene_type:complete
MEIEEIRKQVDELDDEILNNLIKRKDLVKELSTIKKEMNTPVFDEKRETEILNRLRKKAKEYGLEENFVAAIFKIILENSKLEQEKEESGS